MFNIVKNMLRGILLGRVQLLCIPMLAVAVTDYGLLTRRVSLYFSGV